MRHVIFAEEQQQYSTAILIKDAALNKNKLEQHYIDRMTMHNEKENFIGFSLQYKDNNKCPVGFAKDYLAKLLPALDSLGVTTLFVCDTIYFKVLTGEKKTDANLGYVKPCVINGYEHMNVITCANYQVLFYNPALQPKIDLGITTLTEHLGGTHQEIGKDIIHSEQYPSKLSDIEQLLDSLHQYPTLTCDLEAFSLQFWKAGVGTIGFAWDEHNGAAFLCDYRPYIIPLKQEDGSVHYGKQVHNEPVKLLLLKFFLEYEGKLIFHNANYDAKIIIYELFMNSMLDTEGIIKGINALCTNFDDTKLITYLAVNSCAGNKLDLKSNSHEFAGNYAQEDINDIRLIPPTQLLTYNLIDCLCTWFVYNKNHPKMIADNQLGVYETIKKPSVPVILQIELNGMCLDWNRVHEVKDELEAIEADCLKRLHSLSIVKDYWKVLRQKESDKMHEKWKQKTAPIEHFDYVEFNPASNPQMQAFVYDYLGYEVIDLTKSKQPAVGAKTLKKISKRAKNAEHEALFEVLIDLAKVSKILTTFITAFLENSVQKEDGYYYLHGSFNIGGTVSGRLSSSSPNLQTIPSGSTYAKLIKSCFVAPEGWIMVGCDFALTIMAQVKDIELLELLTRNGEDNQQRSLVFLSYLM